MKMIVVRAMLLLLVLAAGVYAIITGIPAYLRSEGAAAAARDWEEGVVIVPHSDAYGLSIMFDERTGLAHVNRPWSELFCEGYNNYVNQRLKKGDVPSNARKQWAREIAKPEHYIASLPSSAIFPLTPGGPAYAHPATRTEFRLLSITRRGVYPYQLLIPHKGRISSALQLSFDMTFEAAVGPDGSDTLFLRSFRSPTGAPPSSRHAVIDLRNGQQLK